MRVAASEGEANAALVELLARELDVPSRDVALIAGATARIKRIKITGASSILVASLAKLVAIG